MPNEVKTPDAAETAADMPGAALSAETRDIPSPADAEAGAQAALHRPRGHKKPPNKRRRKIIARCIVLVVVLALAAGLGFAVYEVFLKPPPVYYDTVMVYRGTLENTAWGGGYAKAADSADIAVKQAGRVLESYFSTGDEVFEGDLLFVLDASPIDKAIADLEAEIAGFEAENENYYAAIAEEWVKIGLEQAKTTVSAPFAGKLIQLNDGYINIGDMLDPRELGLFVDDNTMLLTLYYSYAYENDIRPGMKAQVSIPSSMSLVDATVGRVEKIRKITPEGAVLFEVELTMKNPGALTKDMVATAIIRSASGEEIIPSEPGSLRYLSEQTLTLGTRGIVTRFDMREYYTYDRGHVFCRVEYEPNMSEIERLEAGIERNSKSIADTRAKIAEEAKKYDDLEIYAPISGTVMYNRLAEGDMAEPGQGVISIAQLSNMVIEAQIDERNISGIQAGKMVMCEVYSSDAGYQMFSGEILSVSLEAKNENGYNYFPAIVSANNFGGVILPGMWVNFTVTLNAVYDALIAPINAIKFTPAGETAFVKADEPPPNTVELPPEIMAQVPPGFYPVSVVTGMGNNQGVEIKEGVNEGDRLYTQDLDYDPESIDGGPGGYPGGGGTIARPVL
ncbi:MAG: HlyD family efflux transporter periplasmic adaptor subunit, partial [Oscillospiraceae bacterium]|nr:HlyD family efflux transporter periplasmic adaptor subunit [Oscillospiraceae bacterium]